mmetsp:Transcript_24311/g.55631  ORF Transcript_24311/g.55631 Transcript_24311/m.55631 type:complete len:85 (-) Transcript_24311:511-765(-)
MAQTLGHTPTRTWQGVIVWTNSIGAPLTALRNRTGLENRLHHCSCGIHLCATAHVHVNEMKTSAMQQRKARVQYIMDRQACLTQ